MVIGAAFTAVVTAFVGDLLTPLIAAIAGKPDFSSLQFTINNSTFHYGHFLNAIISFLLVAAAVYFAVVLPLQALDRRRKAGVPEAAPAKPEEVRLLSQIRDLLEHPRTPSPQH
ncbi:MAG TPA: large conductance mechanosensitive channel protein MscL [Polyangia bacterium]